MTIRTAPCDWPVVICPDDPNDECDGCPDYASLDAATRALVDEAAVAHLWNWSGRQFGTCPVTIRPCRTDCCSGCDVFFKRSLGFGYDGLGVSSGPYYPALLGGQWWNLTCGTCGDNCSCEKVCEVVLPGPVHQVSEVLLDGVPLLDVEYRVDNHRRLVRVPWQTFAFTDPELAQAPSTWRYNTLGDDQWRTQFSGWSASPTMPVSSGGTPDPGGDWGQAQWPPMFVARGQFIRIFVPAASSVSINTPERGVTIGKTDAPSGNGVHDDAAGTYSGGFSGTEYVIRFDGVQTVTFVTQDAGVEVREMGYMRAGGDECWPTCQSMSNPDSVGVRDLVQAEGTWSVTYDLGVPVPAGGQLAAGLLACEFAKAVCGSSECALPARVQSITRQGVTAAFASDLAAVWTRGETGIPQVDLWLASVTQPRQQFGARVFSPDAPRFRRTTHGG